MVLMEFSISPLGEGSSVSQYVARCIAIVEASGLDYEGHDRRRRAGRGAGPVEAVQRRDHEEL